MLVSVGLNATEAAAMFLPQVIGAVVAGLLMGAVADRAPARYLMAISMVLLATSLLLVSFIAPGWQVFVYAISIGAAMGAQRPLLSTILPRWYGLGHIGAIQGVTAFLGVAASATGPVALLARERAAWRLWHCGDVVGDHPGVHRRCQSGHQRTSAAGRRSRATASAGSARLSYAGGTNDQVLGWPSVGFLRGSHERPWPSIASADSTTIRRPP